MLSEHEEKIIDVNAPLVVLHRVKHLEDVSQVEVLPHCQLSPFLFKVSLNLHHIDKSLDQISLESSEVFLFDLRLDFVSDSVSVMVLCAHLLDLVSELDLLSLVLGSDFIAEVGIVQHFFLTKGFVNVRGRGESLEPLGSV